MPTSPPDPQRLLHFIRQMLRIRAFEVAAKRALEAGLAFGAVHPSIGQEAVAVGVCDNLDAQDIILSTHRGHGHTLAKGAEPLAMMRELFGRAGGICQGKGGSMHIADFSVGMLGANGVVAANINIAVGAAHAIRLQGDRRVVVCFFGDGAINRGPFLEGLNWAGVFGLPVLFVCEDNQFSATTRTAAMTAGAGAGARAAALGLQVTEVDGNDIIAVDAAARRLLAHARQGQPQMLVAQTYRLSGHTVADAAAYRPAQEVDEQWLTDPVERARQALLAAGIAASELDALAQQADEEMAAVYAQAEQSDWPDTAAAWTEVQDIGNPMVDAY